MAFLTPEQKNSLGPFLEIFIFLLALAGAVAINTMAGGPRVPVISDFAGIILGVVAFFIFHKQLKK